MKRIQKLTGSILLLFGMAVSPVWANTRFISHMINMHPCECRSNTITQNLLNQNCRSRMVDCVLTATSAKKQEQYINKLISFLEKDNPDKQAAATSIFILGKVEAIDAIDVLIDQLEVSYLDTMKDLPYQMADPPEALICIGKPALLPLIRAVRTYQAPVTRQVIASIMYQILEGKPKALAYLENLPDQIAHEQQAAVAFLTEKIKEME